MNWWSAAGRAIPGAYSELYQKYSKAMYNTSLRIMNNSGDAEDVLQESFCDAFAAIGSFAYKSTFGAWLKRIVINKSINALRKRKMDDHRHGKNNDWPFTRRRGL